MLKQLTLIVLSNILEEIFQIRLPKHLDFLIEFTEGSQKVVVFESTNLYKEVNYCNNKQN